MKTYLVEKLGEDGMVEKRHWFASQHAASVYLGLLLDMAEEAGNRVIMLDAHRWVIVDDEKREHRLYLHEVSIPGDSELAKSLQE